MNQVSILLSQSGIFQAGLFRQYFLGGKANEPVEVRLGETVYSFQHELNAPENLGIKIGPVTIGGQKDTISYDWLSAGRHKFEISRYTYKNRELVKSQHAVLDRAAEQGRSAVGSISFREHSVEEASGQVEDQVFYRDDTRAVLEVKKLLEEFDRDQ